MGCFGAILRFIGRWWLRLIVLIVMASIVLTGVTALWGLTITGVIDVQPFRWLFVGDEGEPLTANPAAVAAVDAKLDDATQDKSAWSVTLTDDDLTTLLVDTLSDNTPVSDVQVRTTEEEVRFDGHLRGRGNVGFSGAVGVSVDAGAIQIETKEFDVGVLSLPGATQNLVDEVAAEIVNINGALERPGTTGMLIQGVDLQDGQITISGTQTGGEVITSDALLQSLSEGAPAGQLPPERLPEGSVNAKEAPGTPLYVAIGDSLANGDRASSQAAGYVSRFHAALEEREGAQLGLRNLGVSGETSAGLIANGQLQSAKDLAGSNQVSTITVDIGGNDLLGHLASDDCQEDFESAACQARIEQTEDSYEQNIDRIFRELRDAAPNATILFLDTYNPFNVGFDSLAFTNGAVASLNQIAREAAAKYNVRVANGFDAIGANAGGLTYILEGDIHPTDLGYDQLGWALVQALGE